MKMQRYTAIRCVEIGGFILSEDPLLERSDENPAVGNQVVPAETEQTAESPSQPEQKVEVGHTRPILNSNSD